MTKCTIKSGYGKQTKKRSNNLQGRRNVKKLYMRELQTHTDLPFLYQNQMQICLYVCVYCCCCFSKCDVAVNTFCHKAVIPVVTFLYTSCLKPKK